MHCVYVLCVFGVTHPDVTSKQADMHALVYAAATAALIGGGEAIPFSSEVKNQPPGNNTRCDA